MTETTLPIPNGALPALRRLADWEVRLAACFRRCARERFGWGSFDCLILPADCILAMTDIDPMARWRGRYASRREADALLADLAPEVAPVARLAHVVGAVLAAHGAHAISPRHAGHGDIALVDWPDAERDGAIAPHCGVVGGAHILLPARVGLAVVPADRARHAWRIG
ncbi:hypothetical protein KAJ83_09785 [Marivibrio halodurans]|uniref:DUF6950 domain-containing protein n=1 Tax=Marivibrio halodurans TaxID=2039722 RepID=A0A8J7V449_9PROT|nr:hypothetical protein [Marivibrio halodurans]MBP5857299.1 hypothetical protein [Marivibrio halodurans]